MRVYGYEITTEHSYRLMQEILRRTKTGQGMANLEAVCFLEKIGVPTSVRKRDRRLGVSIEGFVAHRAADRLLQHYRKQGLIELRKGSWFALPAQRQETA